MKSKFSVSLYGSNDVTGGTETYWDWMTSHFNFKQINYNSVRKVFGVPALENLGFCEVDGTEVIEEYVKKLERYSDVKMFIKNGIQLPHYYPKAHTVCVVHNAHKYAAERLYKLGYYNMLSYERIGKVFHHYEEESCKTSDVVVAVSDFMADIIRKTFRKDVHVSSPHVVPHGVNLNVFKPLDKTELRAKYNIPTDKKVGIWVGRFHPQKGWHIMADLIWARQDIHWIVVFMDENDFESSRPNVTIFKKVAQNLMPEIYNLADFMVMPSICESFCLSSLEGTSCGLPVIAFKTGWHWNDESKWGEVVTDWKSSAFQDKIDKVLNGSYEPLETASNYSLEKWKKMMKPVVD